MTTDVEMKEDGDKQPESATNAEQPSEPSAPKLETVLANNLQLIQRAVAAREASLLFWRVLRQTATVRNQFSADALAAFVQSTLPDTSSIKGSLKGFLSGSSEEAMAVEGSSEEAASASAQPEEEAYCTFLVCQHLADTKQWDPLFELTNMAVQHLKRFNRRTLDVLAARIYHYLSLAYEKRGRLEDIRATLLELHCTSVLRHDDFGQEVLLNLILRNYLHYNLYEQAEKLRAQAQRPESARSNQQYSRYLYYLGRIRAVQLEYSEAKECLQQASRKAPLVAKGFSICVHKWLLVIRLLLGEIPERAEFQQPGMAAALKPYLELTHAVRSGDVKAFNHVAQLFHNVFAEDRTHNLINRLRYNVIRAGLRRISIAYSSISLKDVAAKLGLSSVKDTESVVAKTIRDGSISAVIDHEKQVLMSKEVSDIYMSSEPQQAFHARTAFCMDIHNEAVKAMRYDEPKKDELKTTETEAGFEEAIAAVMAEDDRDF